MSLVNIGNFVSHPFGKNRRKRYLCRNNYTRYTYIHLYRGKKMKHRIIIWLFILFATTFAYAQELDCKVVINSQKIQGTNAQVFKTLETALTEFLNDASGQTNNMHRTNG